MVGMGWALPLLSRCDDELLERDCDRSPWLDIARTAGGDWIPWDEVTGTRHMLYARNIVFSRSSRGLATIAFALFRTRFWMFDAEAEERQISC
jgi:hypothetical protein